MWIFGAGGASDASPGAPHPHPLTPLPSNDHMDYALNYLINSLLHMVYALDYSINLQSL
jgi:hypothetical protein